MGVATLSRGASYLLGAPSSSQPTVAAIMFATTDALALGHLPARSWHSQ